MTSESDRDQRSAGVALKLVGAWTLVGIPLAWGVWQVIQKSLALFK
jgi:hypothetical protein